MREGLILNPDNFDFFTEPIILEARQSPDL